MGTILHYVLSLVKTVVVGAGLDSRAGEAAQARAAEVPGVRAALQLPRPRAGEAVEGDGARDIEVLDRVAPRTRELPRARSARRARAVGLGRHRGSPATLRTGWRALLFTARSYGLQGWPGSSGRAWAASAGGCRRRSKLHADRATSTA